jgi:hypothetical protein
MLHVRRVCGSLVVSRCFQVWLPTWHEVQQRHVEAWASPPFTIDTARTQPDAALAAILTRLEGLSPR